VRWRKNIYIIYISICREEEVDNPIYLSIYIYFLHYKYSYISIYTWFLFLIQYPNYELHTSQTLSLAKQHSSFCKASNEEGYTLSLLISWAFIYDIFPFMLYFNGTHTHKLIYSLLWMRNRKFLFTYEIKSKGNLHWNW